MSSKKYRNRPNHARNIDRSLQRLGQAYEHKHKDTITVINKEHKLSAAIIDIAQPLLDQAPSVEEKEWLLQIAMIAWMRSLLPDDEKKEKLPAELLALIGDDPEVLGTMEALFDIMIARKQELHPDDRRIPLESSMEVIGGRLQFNVVGTPSEETIKKLRQE